MKACFPIASTHLQIVPKSDLIIELRLNKPASKHLPLFSSLSWMSEHRLERLLCITTSYHPVRLLFFFFINSSLFAILSTLKKEFSSIFESQSVDDLNYFLVEFNKAVINACKLTPTNTLHLFIDSIYD